MENIKKHPFTTVIAIACIVFGIYMLVQDVESIKNSIFGILGLAIIVLSACRLYTYYKETKTFLKLPLITLVIGILLLFQLANFIFLVIAIILLFEPISNIIKSNNKKQQLIFELPEIIFAIVIILLATTTIFYTIIFRILGCVLLIIALYLCICIFNDTDIKMVRNDIIDQED